jgi:hypothetical protein
MKKYFGLSLLFLGSSLLFTGCGSQDKITTPITGTQIKAKEIKAIWEDTNMSNAELQNGKYFLVLANGDYSMLSMVKRNNHIIAGIQAAAQDTLSNGYKYFAVVKPNELSNIKGSKINTFAEFKNECVSSNPFGGSDSCNISNDSWLKATTAIGHFFGDSSAHLLIKVYKEKPTDIEVYDADQLIKDIKQDKSFQEEARK